MAVGGLADELMGLLFELYCPDSCWAMQPVDRLLMDLSGFERASRWDSGGVDMCVAGGFARRWVGDASRSGRHSGPADK